MDLSLVGNPRVRDSAGAEWVAGLKGLRNIATRLDLSVIRGYERPDTEKKTKKRT